jgi:aryl sulfotransferase
MQDAAIQWPQKQRELHNHHFDSTIWNDFKFRDDDIIIGTYAKSGTTWTQQIVGQLLFNGAEDISVAELSLWLDLRVPPKDVKLPAVEAQTDRRFIKTHLPLDALRFSPRAKYIYIGRDGRDVIFSLYNHHANATEDWYRAINPARAAVGPPVPRAPDDIRQYYREWLKGDGYPFWPFFPHVKSWWEVRDLPNVMLLHFSRVKQDLPGEIRRIAAFLDIPIDEERFPAIVEHCSFDWMKQNARKAAPVGGAFWEGGAETFIHKGVNGRWRDVLSPEECSAYELRARAELGGACATWLAGN